MLNSHHTKLTENSGLTKINKSFPPSNAKFMCGFFLSIPQCKTKLYVLLYPLEQGNNEKGKWLQGK